MIDLKSAFFQLYENYEANIRPVMDYDEIWFIGDMSPSFALRASTIAKSLENFKGIVVASISMEKRIRIDKNIDGYKFWGYLDFDEVIERSKRKKILIVNFNDTKAGCMFSSYLEKYGVEICDYIRLMNDLKICHTYLTVNEERQYYLKNIEKFIELIHSLSDDLSKKTVIARINTFISLDRKWLFDIAQGYDRFNSRGDSFRSLNITKEDVYIDVGAAHGDTVSEFFNISLGKYNEIYAFEPDPINFNALKKLCAMLPNANCYNLGVSDESGEIGFFEDPNNRFGSRFQPSDAKLNNVKVVRLDEVVNTASLIKIDVEGFEARVIKGASRIIKLCGPSMHVAGYHYPQDLISIIEVVKDIRPYKNIAIRHCDSSLYDTNILFSERQNFY
jgi:FkbM family methyltransferase